MFKHCYIESVSQLNWFYKIPITKSRIITNTYFIIYCIYKVWTKMINDGLVPKLVIKKKLAHKKFKFSSSWHCTHDYYSFLTYGLNVKIHKKLALKFSDQ